MWQRTWFGPPGCGKTREFVQQVRLQILTGTDPLDICAVTFTRMAAAEFRNRLLQENDLGLTVEMLANMRTMHSLCYRLLGLTKERIASGHLREFVKAYPQYPMSDRRQPRDDELLDIDDELGETILDGDLLLATWGYIRNHGITDVDEAVRRGALPRGVDVNPYELKIFAEHYEGWKRDNGYMDFTDMLLIVWHERVMPAARVYFLDEAQDFTPLQWAIWDQWTEGASFVGLFGDDDQCIYEWLGASPRDFLDRAERGEKTVLMQSYRCPRDIVRIARAVIELNRQREPKDYQGRDADGVYRIAANVRRALADDIETPTFILARHRYLLDHVAQALVDDGIPYENRRGASPLRTKAAKAMAAAAMLHGGNPISWKDWLALQACLPASGNGALLERGAKEGRAFAQARETLAERNAVTFEDLASLGVTAAFYERFEHDWSSVVQLHVSETQRRYLKKVYERYDLPGLMGRPAITLSTIHGVKGEERERVILLTDLSRRAWHEYQENPEAERRVLYVALTRASQEVVIVEPRTRQFWQEVIV